MKYDDSEIYFQFNKYLYINYNINIHEEECFYAKQVWIIKLVYFQEIILLL